MIEKPLTLITCPACNNVVTRDILMDAAIPLEFNFQMALKCPHCKHPVRVEIKTIFSREIRVNGVLMRNGKGEEGNGIRTLS